MVILQALLAALFRSIGNVLNTAFGWATVMLFGKVPRKRQIYVSIVSLCSILWIGAVMGAIYPPLASFLLLSMAVPPVSDSLLRIVMMTGMIVIPLLVGGVALFLFDPARRPASVKGTARALLMGYPYTLGMGLTFVLLIVVFPVLKVRDLVKGWSSTHIPIIVMSRDYESVIDQIKQMLLSRGLHTTPGPASWLVRLPTKLLTWFAGGVAGNLVGEKLVTLRSEGLEVQLHPFDLVVRGEKANAALANSALAEWLPFSKAYLTWDKEANELEDRLNETLCQLLQEVRAGAVPSEEKLRSVEQELRRGNFPYEEWAVLFRVKLQLEREILRASLGHETRTMDLAQAVASGRCQSSSDDVNGAERAREESKSPHSREKPHARQTPHPGEARNAREARARGG